MIPGVVIGGVVSMEGDVTFDGNSAVLREKGGRGRGREREGER